MKRSPAIDSQNEASGKALRGAESVSEALRKGWIDIGNAALTGERQKVRVQGIGAAVDLLREGRPTAPLPAAWFQPEVYLRFQS